MFIIIGIVIVFGCVIGGFLMIDGPLGVLVQPSEFVVIGGAVIGADRCFKSHQVFDADYRHLTCRAQRFAV